MDATGASGMAPMSVSDACPAVHFLVPIFTSESTSANGTTTSSSSYHTASDEAHIVLGVFLLLMVAAWAAFVMEIFRVRAASRCSGVCQTMMGVYLFSWVFYFMNPDHVVGLFWYSTRDLLQLQHIAIASLLLSGGLIEVLQSCSLLPPMSQVPSTPSAALHSSALSPAAISAALAASRTGSYWHVLWSTNLILTGMVFMLHPQHTYGATVKHLLLGTSLILGSPLFIRAKSLAWKLELEQQRRAAQGLQASTNSSTSSSSSSPFSSSSSSLRSNHVDWSMIVAGGSFALAACILLAFREKEEEVHVGTEKTCQPSFVICIISYICAGGSTLAATIVAVRQYRADQRARADDPSATSCLCSRNTCLSLYRRRIRGWTSLALGGESAEENQPQTATDATPSSSSPEVAGYERRRSPDEEEGEHAREDADGDIELATASLSNRALHAVYGGLHGRSTGNGAGSNGKSAIPPPPSAARTHQDRSLPPPSSTAHTLGDLGDYSSGEESAHDEAKTEEDQREQERDRRRQEEWTGEEEA